MLFALDYLDAADRQARMGLEMGGRSGAALVRLAAAYLSYAANGLAPLPQAVNDDETSGLATAQN
jgi:hypothetical protein